MRALIVSTLAMFDLYIIINDAIVLSLIIFH